MQQKEPTILAVTLVVTPRDGYPASHRILWEDERGVLEYTYVVAADELDAYRKMKAWLAEPYPMERTKTV